MIAQTQFTNKKVVISTTLSSADYNYAKNNHLMFSKLIENAISIHRVAHAEGIDENYHNYLKRKLEAMNIRLQKALDFIETQNLSDKYINEVK